MPLLHYQMTSFDPTAGELVTTWYQSAQNATVANAMGSISLGSIILLTATVIDGGLTVTTGTQSAFDAARLEYATANGRRTFLIVPGFDPARYLADGETVNPSDSGVLALNTAMLANGATAGGATISSYIGGTRVRLRAAPVGHR